MPQTVVSGVPYVVSMVDGQLALTLDDFVGAHHLLLTHTPHEAAVDGIGRRIGPEIVMFHEKMNGPTGKDAREWRITGRADNGFWAEHDARF